MATLEGTARPVEMDAGVAVSDFFGDLGDCCGWKDDEMSGSGDSLRLCPSSPCGAGGSGAWCPRRSPVCCWEPTGGGVGAC
jgi:hypothetical protein